jgi:hypothetical protein
MATTDNADLARATVRRSAVWTVVAASIMLVYGFFHFAEPSELLADTRAAVGWWGMLYTLRVGGVLLLLSAVACLIGWPFALLLDAVVTAVAGVCLALSGVLLLSLHTIESYLLIAFGALFVHSAFKSWREYRSVRPPGPGAGADASGAAAELRPEAAPEDRLGGPPAAGTPEGYLAAFKDRPADEE